jgi:hypothetical protein
MGWREVLQVKSLHVSVIPHNPQNTQKVEQIDVTANCALNANCASPSEGSKESLLLEALAKACASHDLLPIEARQAMSSWDVSAFDRGDFGDEMLSGFVKALVQRRAMDVGICPDFYSKRADCAGCGPVWLWVSDNVIGCPWCMNRLRGGPIPRPVSIECGGCRNFQRTDHRFLGHCAVGEPEAPAGLVDTDKRCCVRFIPNKSMMNANL